jgi:hypothetical protein
VLLIGAAAVWVLACRPGALLTTASTLAGSNAGQHAAKRG